MPDLKTADGLHKRGLTLVEQGRYTEAILVLEQSLATAPRSQTWNDWAVAKAMEGDLERAEIGFRKAIALQPNYAEAQQNLKLLLVGVKANVVARTSAATSRPLDQFVAEVRRIPQQDPALLPVFQEAFQKTRSESEYFVRRCYDLLSRLPAEALEQGLEKLCEEGQRDHRYRLVLALYHAGKLEWEAAVKQLRAAWEMVPVDLFTERLLIEYSHEWHRADSSVPDPFEGIEEYLGTHFCGKPWSHLEFAPTGDVYACCPGILPVPVGNAQTQSVEETLASPVLKTVRESILNGTFHYCSKINCPQIVGRNLLTREKAASIEHGASLARRPFLTNVGLEEAYSLRPERYPVELSLSYDKTCNLACPSCRTDFFAAGREEQHLMETKYEKYILEMAQRARLVFMDGSGEVFASKHSRKILGMFSRERYPSLKLQIISNGVLFDGLAWETFDLKGRTYAVYISIDAARQETYKIVRRGGDFERLMNNLEFLKGLRENEGEKFRWELHFVVSVRNFREMPEFVQLGKRLGVDWIIFSTLRNWGHISPEEMKGLAVFNPEHPLHAEFRDVLQTPELRDPIVYPGVLSSFQMDVARTSFERPTHLAGPAAALL